MRTKNLIDFNYNCFTYKISFSISSLLSAPAKLNGHAQLDVPGLSQNEIQGLLLGSHHQSQQAINVKREPEDLRIDPKCPRSQKVSRLKDKKNSLLPVDRGKNKNCTVIKLVRKRTKR